MAIPLRHTDTDTQVCNSLLNPLASPFGIHTSRGLGLSNTFWAFRNPSSRYLGAQVGKSPPVQSEQLSIAYASISQQGVILICIGGCPV